MSRLKVAKEVLQAAEEWKVQCLENGRSILGDGDLWTCELFQELKKNYVDRLHEGEGKFLEKLETQLRPASRAAKRLFAEIVWVYWLLSDNRAETKLRKIKQVYEWSDRSLPASKFLETELLSKGFIKVGVAYGRYEWKNICFVILAMLQWTAKSMQERSSLLSDPWKFADWIDAQPETKGKQFRHALMFLLFPGYFEPIVSENGKREIVNALATEADSKELDRALWAIRRRLEKAHPDQEVNFYEEPFKSMWLEPVIDSDELKRTPDSEENDLDDWYAAKFGDANVWVIAPGDRACHWDEFVEKGIAAVGWGWRGIGSLMECESIDELGQRFIENGISENPTNHQLAGWDFAHEMKIGDTLLARKGKKHILGLGRVTGEYEYVSNRTSLESVREVQWNAFDHPIEIHGDIAVKRLTLFSNYTRDVLEIFKRIERNATPPYEIEDALADIFLGERQFRRMLDSLAIHKNLILQGAPGVGKTFIAKRLAWSLMKEKASDRIKLVQFHQSYAYEDFVQGWRPTEDGGFTLRNGVFHDFCERARQHPDQKFVFIIDEINRGNLSKIFGELLMLVEADKRGADYAVSLTYGGAHQEFFVPKNLHILGLMNTADRSLAIVDYALRRRFAFETLSPAFGTESFRSHLHSFGVDHGLVDRIDENFIALNERIGSDRELGTGFEVGHSFFVPNGETDLDEGWYINILETQIEPLLREYWFDQPEKVTEEVEKLRK